MINNSCDNQVLVRVQGMRNSSRFVYTEKVREIERERERDKDIEKGGEQDSRKIKVSLVPVCRV